MPATLASMKGGNCHIQQSPQNFLVFVEAEADSADLDIDSDFLKLE